MKTDFYLIVKENGSIRTVKNRTSLNFDEVSIKMNLEIPDQVFHKPVITGTIKITEDMVSPNELKADVQENISQALSGVEGVQISLTIEDNRNNE